MRTNSVMTPSIEYKRQLTRLESNKSMQNFEIILHNLTKISSKNLPFSFIPQVVLGEHHQLNKQDHSATFVLLYSHQGLVHIQSFVTSAKQQTKYQAIQGEKDCQKQHVETRCTDKSNNSEVGRQIFSRQVISKNQLVYQYFNKCLNK